MIQLMFMYDRTWDVIEVMTCMHQICWYSVVVVIIRHQFDVPVRVINDVISL